MASNVLKKIPIDIGDLIEQIKEQVLDAVNEVEIYGIGDDGNTNFDIDDAEVVYEDGQYLASVWFQRTEGKFCSNSELEEAFISAMGGKTITITVEIQA
jgi:hypothetical protein